MPAITAPNATKTSRKDIATSFLRLSSSGNVREAYDRFVSPSFRHHNPYFRGDAKTLAADGPISRVDSTI